MLSVSLPHPAVMSHSQQVLPPIPCSPHPLLSLPPTCSPKLHHPLSESALSDYEQNEDERMKKSRTEEEQRVRKSNLERKMISLYIDCTE
jgi:hypothetical protein